jgi:hypothetical protein
MSAPTKLSTASLAGGLAGALAATVANEAVNAAAAHSKTAAALGRCQWRAVMWRSELRASIGLFFII